MGCSRRSAGTCRPPSADGSPLLSCGIKSRHNLLRANVIYGISDKMRFADSNGHADSAAFEQNIGRILAIKERINAQIEHLRFDLRAKSDG